MSASDRFLICKQEMIHGPNFVCLSCRRKLFKNGVKILDGKDLQKLKELDEDYLKSVNLSQHKHEESWILCHSCLSYVKVKKMPPINVANGLTIEDIPKELLELNDLENQIIARELLFLKYIRLPKTGMRGMKDQVVCVPLESSDISKTIATLPRHPDESHLIAVKLKRRQDIKNSHLEQYIRPQHAINAIKIFKEQGNQHYLDVVIDENFLDGWMNETEHQDVLSSGDEAVDVLDKEELDSSSESEGDETEPNDVVRKFQAAQTIRTCLVPEDIGAQVVVNNTNKTIFRSRGENKESVAIAPGEGKVPTNWMREKNFDVKAFPKFHPSGKFGLHHPRLTRLSHQMYFSQRLWNEKAFFSQDANYVFMASSYLERKSIEGQIDISAMKGVPSGNSTGVSELNLKDPFDVFKKIRGSPKYWQAERTALTAKVRQLGPFHFFFTFSCGEMRWSEVYVSLFKAKGYNVEIPKDWDGSDEALLVEGVPLWQYVNHHMKEKKHELFKDNIFLITIIYDARVKTFLKNILMGYGRDQVPMSYYSYRVEFQVRGMAHIHGVCWIKPEWLENFGISGDLLDHPDKTIELADKMISCQLPDDDQDLYDIVITVQKHRHSKSCLKYDGICRYRFPRLPSPRTVLARPLPQSMDEKERNTLLKRAKEVMKR